MTGAHQNNTKTFEQLDFSEQAKSITAQIQSLEKAINANVRRAVDENRKSPAAKRLEQVERFVQRLKQNYGL
jgi:acyl-CoA reductase-like NAD-dependent aldehyde dehydrogenase